MPLARWNQRPLSNRRTSVATTYTAVCRLAFISDEQTYTDAVRPISRCEQRRQSPQGYAWWLVQQIRRTYWPPCSRLHECCKIWRTLSSSAFYNVCVRACVCAACKVCWIGAKKHRQLPIDALNWTDMLRPAAPVLRLQSWSFKSYIPDC